MDICFIHKYLLYRRAYFYLMKPLLLLVRRTNQFEKCLINLSIKDPGLLIWGKDEHFKYLCFLFLSLWHNLFNSPANEELKHVVSILSCSLLKSFWPVAWFVSILVLVRFSWSQKIWWKLLISVLSYTFIYKSHHISSQDV